MPIDTDEPARALGGLEPLLVPPRDAFRALGIKNTKGWALIRDGHLVARKIGSRTVIEMESIRRFAADLPRAGRSG